MMRALNALGVRCVCAVAGVVVPGRHDGVLRAWAPFAA